MLRDELRVLEISVWLEQLQNLRTVKLKLESDTAQAKEACDQAQAALDEAYAQGERFTEEMRQNDVAADALRGQVTEAESAAGEESAAIAVLQTSVEHNNESLRRLEQELTIRGSAFWAANLLTGGFNLLPVPPLDGAQLASCLCEMRHAGKKFKGND